MTNVSGRTRDRQWQLSSHDCPELEPGEIDTKPPASSALSNGLESDSALARRAKTRAVINDLEQQFSTAEFHDRESQHGFESARVCRTAFDRA
jgi:hypothetical protein